MKAKWKSFHFGTNFADSDPDPEDNPMCMSPDGDNPSQPEPLRPIKVIEAARTVRVANRRRQSQAKFKARR